MFSSLPKNQGWKSVMALGVLVLCHSTLTWGLNSAMLTAQTLQALPTCLQYQVKGTCLWLAPNGTTNETPYVSHYLPDLVVSVFPDAQKNAWSEVRVLLDEPASRLQEGVMQSLLNVPAGSGDHALEGTMGDSVVFAEVDVLGNPALPLLPTTLALLPSNAVPMQPYFQSMLDSLLWRGFPPAAAEEAYAVTSFRHVGTGPNNWGGIFPHEGKVVSVNEGQAAEVLAMRALDVLTDARSFGHVHIGLPNTCGEQCQASPLLENDSNTRFQRLLPQAETQCQPLGMPSEVVMSPSHQYVWVVWRHYEGCLPGVGQFLQKMIWSESHT